MQLRLSAFAAFVFIAASIVAQEPPATISTFWRPGNEGHMPEGDVTWGDGWLFVVDLAAPLASTVHIKVETVGGTATPGVDYEPLSVVFEYLPGETRQFGRLKLYGDIIDENNETIVFRATQEGELRAQVTGTIDDDDTNPTASIGPALTVAEEKGEVKFLLTVGPKGKVSGRIDYTTVDGTAKAGEDYLPTSGSVEIFPDTYISGRTIPVRILGDTNVESDETFTLQLTNATNLHVSRATATATIANDDYPPPPFLIPTRTMREGNAGTTPVDITLKLGTASTSPVTVAVQSTGNGAATKGVDYEAVSETVTFAPGITELGIRATILGDTHPEDDELFELAILEEGVVRATGFVKIVDDDDSDDATLTIADVQVTETDDDSTTAVFTVTMSAARAQQVRVDYQAVAETALVHDDFSPVFGTVILQPGETSATITVPVTGDGLGENAETFRIDLANAVGAFVDDASGVCTIIDDDGKRRSARH